MNKACLNVLTTRRSTKSYHETPVPKEMLEQVLAAGINAPTGMHRQSPVMVAVTKPETIRTISKLLARVRGITTDPFYGAPCVIVVFADSNVFTYQEDGSLVIGNLLNAAAALDLGACWIHGANEVFATEEGKQLKKKWGLGDSYIGIGHCILGYAKEIAPAKEHKADYVIYDV